MSDPPDLLDPLCGNSVATPTVSSGRIANSYRVDYTSKYHDLLDNRFLPISESFSVDGTVQRLFSPPKYFFSTLD